ncbi:AGC/NDR protein kinase [Dacryopinax primogenitus]|uniref:non-specific serine/threonine protein kinase n=1 Tax=Dacryopinax primogenitus (strain DJM 731) TaxID=1858805 RepID=M5FZI3_DACPD|nr:AGC/NDR protein kinase [Dacryopinax primogenitus]EJT98976.1 AGC/NDR protein kinase [Dacryopinax primogenitus]
MAAQTGAPGLSGAAQMVKDVHMSTAKGFVNLSTSPDIHMETARTLFSGRTGQALPFWQKEKLESAEVKRKATLAQMYFLDYYFQNLGYLAARRARRSKFDVDTAERQLPELEYITELKSYLSRERALLRRRRTRLRVEHFRIVAQVGQGGYGEVFLARKVDSGEICALKKMRKKTLQKMDEVRHVLVERDILTATRTPWLVALLYAFQDADHVYLAMEYVPGGDFRTLLNNSGVLKEEHARFYICEMFAAVNELHRLGYIHRDLKPENFLVDGTGHVKLTDFGLATGALNPTRIDSLRRKLEDARDDEIISRSTMERRSIYKSMRIQDPRYADSIVGSPDYMAPEVLRGKAYTYSVDYWSLGCILFEFLAGFPPFSGASSDETWANLKNWQRVLQRPHYDKPEDLIFNLTDTAWDAITRLIAPAQTRLSNLRDLAAHPFFALSPWSDLRSKQAPFVPTLDSDVDTGYYDDFTNADDMAKYAEVKEKQRNVESVQEKEEPGPRGVWVGFTFGKNGLGPRARGSQKELEAATRAVKDAFDEGHMATIF